MQDQDKNTEQLIDELNQMRRRVAELEAAEARGLGTEKIINFRGVKLDSGEDLMTCEDITDRRRAQESLRDASTFLNTLLNAIPAPLFYKDTDGRYIGFNKSFEEFFGKTRQELVGKSVFDISPWDLAEVYHAKDLELFHNPGAQVYDSQVKDTSGVVHDVVFHKSTFSDPQGHVLGLIGVILDITDRKRAEEALAESEKRYRLIAETIHDCFWMATPDIDKMVYVSPAYETIWRRSCESLYESPRSFIDAIHPDDRDRVLDILDKHKSEVTAWNVVYCIVWPDGSLRWIEDRGFPVLDENGKWYLSIGVATDITERKRLEKERARAEEKSISILESISEAFFSLDDNMVVTYFNQAATKALGRRREEVIGYRLFEVFPEAGGSVFEENYTRSLKEKIPLSFETYFGIPPYANWYDVCIYPEPEGISVFFQVITERKRLEEERLEMERKVLHAQKLESLGVMAGGIAHDFNNQLAVVLGNLDLLLMDRTLDAETRHSIKSAVEAARRSAELSRQMQVYAGNTLTFPVDVDLKELLNRNPSLLKLCVSKYVTLNLEIYNRLPPIKGDADQIERLVMNILVNASEAIGDKPGMVSLTTGVMDCDEAYLGRSRLEDKPAPGRFVFLEVTDTGCGMNTETQHRLFDPFFTTKFWGRGLGMAEVMGTVKGHHGAIMVDSEVGKGTTIRVLFPAADTLKM